jgi:hypothetical protein
MAAYDVSSWHGVALTESLAISLVILWAFTHLAHLGVYTAGVSMLAGYEGWRRLVAPIVVPLNTLGLLLGHDLVTGTLFRLRAAGRRDAAERRHEPVVSPPPKAIAPSR